MFSFSDGMLVYEYGPDKQLDFLSDLGKELEGVRDAWAMDLAEMRYERFVVAHPGETPIVVDGEMLTAAQIRGRAAVEEWRLERKRAEIAKRRREEREAWAGASPMAVALRKAGLAA